MEIKYYKEMSKNLLEELEKNKELNETINTIDNKNDYTFFVNSKFFNNNNEKLKNYRGIKIIYNNFIPTNIEIILYKKPKR